MFISETLDVPKYHSVNKLLKLSTLLSFHRVLYERDSMTVNKVVTLIHKVTQVGGIRTFVTLTIRV